VRETRNATPRQTLNTYDFEPSRSMSGGNEANLSA
jgi:hypothetical protein